jgi:hypothetical protein
VTVWLASTERGGRVRIFLLPSAEYWTASGQSMLLSEMHRALHALTEDPIQHGDANNVVSASRSNARQSMTAGDARRGSGSP